MTSLYRTSTLLILLAGACGGCAVENAKVPYPSLRDPFASPAAIAPSTQPARWAYIVIHHSHTPAGSAASLAELHRSRGWEDLGYHFVIGNGSETADGLIEIGPLWANQKSADRRASNSCINIALVGDLDERGPTPAQSAALDRLVAYLMAEYHIPATQVIGHRDMKPTPCPGRYLDIAEVRRAATANTTKVLAK